MGAIILKLFVHQNDLFVRYGKNLQGEIAIRSQDIAINKKVPLECSEDRATHHCSRLKVTIIIIILQSSAVH